jgi:beta-lactamase regulating signal transducer with metallopeptidase domain
MTTHDVLLGLLKANLALGGGAVAVMLARKPARQVFGAGLTYSLWLIPILATAAVFAPARQVTMTVAAPAPELPVIPSMPIGLDASDYAVTMAPNPIDPWMVTALVWILGLVLMAAWLTLKQMQFMAQVRAGRGGPAVVGLLRPRIVTPADFEQRYTAREQAVVLAHERVHLARQDARINAFAALLRCVCWYNPIVHVAASLMRIDQELACDAKVVADHPKARRPYAEAMLKAEFADRPLPLGCFWPAGTQHPLTERIAMLKTPRPSPLVRFAGASALALVCGGASLAAWASQPASVRVVTLPAAEPSLPTPAPVTAAAAPEKTIILAAAAPRPDPAPVPALAPAPQSATPTAGGVDASGMKTIEGTIVVPLLWTFNTSTFGVRDASGQVTVVTTDDFRVLGEDGKPLGTIPLGTPVSVRGYAASDGSGFFADPADFSTNGNPLFPNAKPQPDNALAIAHRYQVCGSQQDGVRRTPGMDQDTARAAVAAWRTDCEDKLAKNPGPTPDGAVVSHSIISNAVKREGQ